MKVTIEEARDILKKLTPQELEMYKQLNADLRTLNEANASSFVKKISSNWRNWSTAMLMAVMMNPTMATALEKYSPDTYNEIKTELPVATPSPTKSKVVATADFSQTFQSGKFAIKDSKINVKLNTLKDWIKKNSNRKYKIVITAGESKVTNPAGTGEGGVAMKRAKAMEKMLNTFIKQPVEIRTEIGTTSYDSTKDNKDDPKYQEEQFVRVDIETETSNLCGFSVNKPGQEGTAQNNYITYDDYIDGEGSISIKSGKIPDRMVVLDNNGNVTNDLGYVTTEKSSYSQWKYVPKYVLGLTQVRKSGSEAVQGSAIRIIKVKDFEDLIKQISNVAKPDTTINPEEVRQPLQAMKAMIENGEREFVVYENMGTGTIDFADSKGDSKVVVYSPLGSTGYTVKGACK